MVSFQKHVLMSSPVKRGAEEEDASEADLRPNHPALGAAAASSSRAWPLKDEGTVWSKGVLPSKIS